MAGKTGKKQKTVRVKQNKQELGNATSEDIFQHQSIVGRVIVPNDRLVGVNPAVASPYNVGPSVPKESVRDSAVASIYKERSELERIDSHRRVLHKQLSETDPRSYQVIDLVQQLTDAHQHFAATLTNFLSLTNPEAKHGAP